MLKTSKGQGCYECMGFPDHTDAILIQSEMKEPQLPTCVIDESCVMSLSAFGDMDS